MDSSAILSVYFEESLAAWVSEQMLHSSTPLRMSTVNLAECLMRFASKKSPAPVNLRRRLMTSGIDFVPPDVAQTLLSADARDRFPFNLGDCFAYALAKTYGEPLLTLDFDFRDADVAVVLPPK